MQAAYGWEAPIILKLTLPNGRVQNRQVSLLGRSPGDNGLGLSVANFLTDQNIYGSSSSSSETAEVSFNLTQIAGHWKSGLIIKGAILRPK